MMMKKLSRNDFLRRLRIAGAADNVQASQTLQVFRRYIENAFPQIDPNDFEPLFIRGRNLFVRSTNAALMHAVKEREAEIIRHLRETTRTLVDHIRFRA